MGLEGGQCGTQDGFDYVCATGLTCTGGICTAGSTGTATQPSSRTRIGSCTRTSAVAPGSTQYVIGAPLFPKATLVTPNLHEAAALLGRAVESEEAMRDAARAVCDLGAAATLVKGGHLPGEEAVDLFYDGTDFLRLAAPRIETPHTHGTGCTYSAAITALLAGGKTVAEAVRDAKDYISRAITGAPGIGHGHGPVDHLA